MNWLSTSLAFYITAQLLPGFEVKGAKGALIAAAIFGLLQWVIGWFLFGLIGIGTLGLGFIFSAVTKLVVSTILLMLADGLSSNLKIRDKTTAFVGAIAITILSELVRVVGRILL